MHDHAWTCQFVQGIQAASGTGSLWTLEIFLRLCSFPKSGLQERKYEWTEMFAVYPGAGLGYVCRVVFSRALTGLLPSSIYKENFLRTSAVQRLHVSHHKAQHLLN